MNEENKNIDRHESVGVHCQVSKPPQMAEEMLSYFYPKKETFTRDETLMLMVAVLGKFIKENKLL